MNEKKFHENLIEIYRNYCEQLDNILPRLSHSYELTQNIKQCLKEDWKKQYNLFKELAPKLAGQLRIENLYPPAQMGDINLPPLFMENLSGPLPQSVIVGLAIGDSLGATSEFTTTWEVPTLFTHNWPYLITGGGYIGWEAGRPTDDTDLTLAIVKSYAHLGKFDPEDICKYFISWLQSGPADIGGTIKVALTELMKQEKGYKKFWSAAEKAYHIFPKSASNGSLMRNAAIPALLYFANTREDSTVLQCIITHYSPATVLCCFIHTILISSALRYSTSSGLPQPHPPTIEDIEHIVNFDWALWKKETKNSICKHWLEFVEKNSGTRRKGSYS